MYYISVSNQDLEHAVELLADVVQNPNFTGKWGLHKGIYVGLLIILAGIHMAHHSS